MFERARYFFLVDGQTWRLARGAYQTECAALKAKERNLKNAAERMEYWMRRTEGDGCNTPVIRQIMYCPLATTDVLCADCPTYVHKECRSANQFYIAYQNQYDEQKRIVDEFWKNKLKARLK